MRYFLVLTLFFTPLVHAFELLVTGLRNNQGSVRCSVFKTEDGFPSDHSKAILTMTVVPENSLALFSFKDLPDGDYAMALLHDEDSDTRMRTNFMGLPREGWAVSNNAPARMFGAPTFQSAVKSWKQGERSEVFIRY